MAMLAPILIVAAAFAGVRLKADAPPTLVHDGAPPVWRFAPGAEWPVLPAIVVQMAPGAAPPAGATPLGGPFWRIHAPEPVAEALRWLGQPGVADAFPDVVLEKSRRDVSFDDPEYGGQWYLERLEAELLFERSLGDPALRVAVIDSGIDIAHVDLADAVYEPYDALDDDDDPSPNAGEYCSGPSTDICDEHGTAVSGVMVARADNGAGIVGLCPTCTLVPIKMLGEPDGGISVTIAAFEHAIARDVAVINNSWGYTSPTNAPALLEEVIRRATTEPRDGLGALVVFAAGNDDREIEDGEVEALDDVLCVSAIDSYGYPTAYTNYGAAIEVAAPSATVTIAPGDEVTETFGGTSAAAPVVSGLAAWAAAFNPDLSAVELHDLMVAAAIQSPLITPDEDGHHDIYGYGVVSARQMLIEMGELEDTGVADSGFADTGTDKPRACGCATGTGPSTWAAALLGLLLLRRRR